MGSPIVRVYAEGDLADFSETTTPARASNPNNVFLDLDTAGTEFTRSIAAEGELIVGDSSAVLGVQSDEGDGVMRHRVNGDLNFSAPPNIPLNAQIVMVVWRFDYQIEYALHAQFTGLGTAQAGVPAPNLFPDPSPELGLGIGVSGVFEGGDAFLTFQSITPDMETSAGFPDPTSGPVVDISNAISGTFELEIPFEEPLTFDQLVMFFTTQRITFTAGPLTQSNQNGAAATHFLDVAIASAISNWEFEVHYFAGGGGPTVVEIEGNGGIIYGLADGGEAPLGRQVAIPGNGGMIYGLAGGGQQGEVTQNLDPGPDGPPYDPVPDPCDDIIIPT